MGNSGFMYTVRFITDENHKKLSKRCGHASYEDLIDQGFVSEAVVNLCGFAWMVSF